MNTLVCSVCGKEVDSRGLRGHMRSHDKIAAQGTCPPPEQPGEVAEAPPSSKKTVLYRSPRARSLRIIVEHSRWQKIETPHGSYMERVPGKAVQFENGVYTTDDPEIIKFMDKYKSDPKNKRYSIMGDDDIAEMRKCLSQ